MGVRVHTERASVSLWLPPESDAIAHVQHIYDRPKCIKATQPKRKSETVLNSNKTFVFFFLPPWARARIPIVSAAAGNAGGATKCKVVFVYLVFRVPISFESVRFFFIGLSAIRNFSMRIETTRWGSSGARNPAKCARRQLYTFRQF